MEAVPEEVKKEGEAFDEPTRQDDDEVIEVTSEMIISSETVEEFERRKEQIQAEKEKLAADIESLKTELQASRKSIDAAEKSIVADLTTVGIQELVAETALDQFVHDFSRGEVKLTSKQEVLMAAFGLDRAIEMANLILQAHETKQMTLETWRAQAGDLETALDPNRSPEHRTSALLKKSRRRVGDIGATEAIQKIAGIS